MLNYLKRSWKKLLKHIIIFAISFLAIHYIMDSCGLEETIVEKLGTAGIVGVLLIYGFKYHIICCALPAIVTWLCNCKCHDKCNHNEHHK